jgi:hypothetical protein
MEKVENQVYDRLGEEIHYIIVDLINFVDLPTSLMVFGIGAEENREETFRRNFFKKLDFLCKADSISMNDLFRKMVRKGGFGEIYFSSREIFE